MRVLAFLLLLPSLAFAQTDPAVAAELFKQGRDAMQAGEFSSACPKLAESMKLDERVGTAVKLAECEEKLGQLANARTHLMRAIDLARVTNDDRLTLVRERFDAIDRRVPRLTITLRADAPAATIVQRDGIPVGRGSIGVALPVDPGMHLVVVRADGFAERSFKIELRESEPAFVEVGPGEPIVIAQPTPPPRPIVVTPTRTTSSPLRPIGIALGVAGATSLAMSFVSGAIALERNGASRSQGCGDKTCPSQQGVDTRNAAATAGDFATATFVIGGVLLVAGVIVYLVAPKNTTVGVSRLELLF